MTLAQARTALDALDDLACCTGTYRLAERLALALPDGDLGAAGDANFVPWLLAHSEPAPYGQGTVTKIDPKVRSAQRLIAREQVRVHGFEPAAILDEIEAALSPTRKLSARLTDVIVYRKGDKFTRHKDTPRAAELVATLIVGLPVAHTGGAFVVDDGRGAREFDWSKHAGDSLPWLALFSDVDHEVKPVKSGARVMLVYALHRTEEPRAAGSSSVQDIARRAASALSGQTRWPVMIACGRQVIADPELEQPQSIDTLRGADRDIADAIVEAGFRVDVRACMAAIPNYDDPPRWPDTANLWSITRLASVPPPTVLENMNEEGAAGDIEEYMLDQIPIDQCVVRRSAAATLIHENGLWAEQGMAFGNEGFDALLYTLAALEVSPARKAAKKTSKPKAKAKAKPKAKKKTKAKGR